MNQNLTEANVRDETLIACLDSLRKLREETLEPSRFWSLYLEAMRVACKGELAIIGIRAGGDGTEWQTIAASPASRRGDPALRSLPKHLATAEDAFGDECAAVMPTDDGELTVLRLETGPSGPLCIALFLFTRSGKDRALASLPILTSLNDLAATYQLSRQAAVEMARSEQLAGALDLLTMLNSQDRYLAAAMTFCNELSSRMACERVSLGWLKGGYVRLQAISHVDEFDKKMDAVQQLEQVMEEALDQDSEVVVPVPDETTLVTRDHQAYADGQEASSICSLPLRLGGELIGVVTLERNGEPFSESDVALLRLYCDQAVRRLDDLKRRDRWFGARLGAYVTEKLKRLVGYEHAWAKALGGLAFVALAVLCFFPVTYRLSATATLRTDDVSYLTAPFDGYIEEVHVKVGDLVASGDTLLAMDQNDLLLEEAELAAEANRYQRELEKARADQSLADMRIAGALRDQAMARLERVRYHLGQAVIQAPYGGVVVEGDQNERVGSPVTQGDVLFRVGRIDRLHAELEVEESEIQHVETAMDGEIALASRPQDAVPIRVTVIEPTAAAREEGNAFVVRCDFPEGHPSWWKPGMTGVAKLNAADQTWLWIFTHKTVDFLQLRLWW